MIYSSEIGKNNEFILLGLECKTKLIISLPMFKIYGKVRTGTCLVNVFQNVMKNETLVKVVESMIRSKIGYASEFFIY